MAAPKKSRKSKAKQGELAGQSDPRAPLDSPAFLAAAKPVLARLEEDLIERAKASPAVTAALTVRFEAEKAANRTAESFAGWSAALATQVAAAWLLSCVFVRTLEDRGLLKQARLAGPGAEDSQRQFFQLAPSLTERDYLLTVFRELAHHPAAKELFDAEHSLVWKLSPSAEATKELLALFRTPSTTEPAFRFGQASTRFLGDLYQDLSEDVRKRYALLQTPDFVESYILDHTLEPAIKRFGLDDTTLIDPTCGSGHFLLGAFDRLFEHRLRAEPGIDARVAATKALDCVFGADINPYAVAIARLRLTLAFLDKGGYTKLADAPTLPLHLVVADSLRINPQHPQQELWQHAGAGAAGQWLGDVFTFDDEVMAKDVLGRPYAAVVANPPYITVKDAALREVYRAMYTAAAGKYALSAPFCERIFQLARPRGFTGQITANSFMKREFGKKLIEEYLPTVNLERIINTSGAYIPGHGTPTVLLFGTNEVQQGAEVHAVLAKRGEPSTPEDPSQGLVWRSIVDHGDELGFENDYVSVAHVARDSLAKHPWSLGGGGASALKDLIEERASKRLGAVVEDIGFASFTGLDDAFIIPVHTARTYGLEEEVLRPMVIGESVRDWWIDPEEVAVTPYNKADHSPMAYEPRSRWGRFLWRYRTVAKNVTTFGGRTREDDGQNWWEWYRWQRERYVSTFRIAFAFVATHNHFVFDRGGKVFKQSAPIIKLPESATEDDHLALLAYLNSSTACFWMKQVSMLKGTQHGSEANSTPYLAAYEFDGTKLRQLPIPHGVFGRYRSQYVRLARRLCSLADQRGNAVPKAHSSAIEREALIAFREQCFGAMIALQEEIDWLVYQDIELLPDAPSFPNSEADVEGITLGGRPFEILLGRNVESVTMGWFRWHGSTPFPDVPNNLNAWQTSQYRERLRLIESTPELLILESEEFKRRWVQVSGKAGQELETDRKVVAELMRRHEDAIIDGVLAAASEPLSAAQVRQHLGSAVESETDRLDEMLTSNSVPFLAAYTHSESGLVKLSVWNETWDLQRAEDQDGIPRSGTVPPKFAETDYESPEYYRLRGRLNVPKERFISYPGCESDMDGRSLFSWAGWDHRQRAQALASLYLKRKDGEGWTKNRLTPMLAGLLELIPWVKQWHNEPSPEFGGLRMGEYFEQFLDGECRQHGLTHDDLRAWRPPMKTRSGGKRSKRKKDVVAAESTEDSTSHDDADAVLKPKKTRAKKKRTNADAVVAATEAE